jgi:hypothetical protein
MNARLLGILCIVGSLAAFADGLRMVAIGTTHEGTFRDPDALNYLLSMVIWYIGLLCGMLGIIALRATGANIIFRLLSWLPVVGSAVAGVGGLFGLAGVPVSENVPLQVGGDLYMVGLLVVSILVLAARVWRGWRAFVPLLNVIAIPLGGLVYELLGGLDGGWYITNAAAAALLGYAIMSSVPTAEVRRDIAAAASA